MFKNMKIQSIDCLTQFGECNENLKNELSKANKKNIFESFLLAKTILKKNKNILEYSVNFELPLKLKINIIERFPILAFKLNNGNYALLDKNGEIISNVKDTNLPKILSSNELKNNELVFVISLMRDLNFFYDVSMGKIADNALMVEIQSKKIIFPVVGDKDLLLGSLNLIFSRLRELKDASTIGIIDLRFKNPILR